MPKTGRWTGPSRADGSTQKKPVLELPAGGEVDLAGKSSELRVAGSISALGIDPAHRSTFGVSPIVPNPVSPAGPTGAASIGEVQDLIAAEPVLSGASTLHIGTMGARGIFSPISNTAAETTLLTADFAMPALPAASTFRAMVGGLLANSSGSPKTYTFRLRADATELAIATVTLASDADTARGYRFVVEGESIGGSLGLVANVVAAGGAVDGVQQNVNEALVGAGGTAQAWDLTVQMSAASASASVYAFTSSILYTLP